METSFQEFLRQKTEGSDWSDRNRRRREWLDALNRLFDQIRDFVREADSEGFLELVSYPVQRVENRLGVYDAPAMKIHLDLDFVDIQPMGRFATGTLSFQQVQALWRNERKWGDLSGGRVDMTDGERRYILLRSITDGRDCWYAVPGDLGGVPAPFDSHCLQIVLQDFWK